MKRLTAILVAGLFVLAPLSASAMEMMSDSNMKDVTGQAGVSIAIDDVVIYQESIADTTYWDTDGNLKYVSSATVETGLEGVDPATADYYTSGETVEEYGVNISYANNAKRLITLDAITNADVYNSTFMTDTFTPLNSVDSVSGYGIDTRMPSALTIDVGVCNVLTAGHQFKEAALGSQGIAANALGNGNIIGVVIGLPTLEITQYHNANRKSISVVEGTEVAENADNAGRALIDIEKSGTSRMAILGGTLEIAPH